jgi:N-methylhydantoinase B
LHRIRSIDPITLEILQNGLGSIVDEMALTVMRTAYSGVVKDALDYSTALCDRYGDMIAQGSTIVAHLGSFPSAVESILTKYAGRIFSGDIFILNDPYGSGGRHLPDVFVIKPVFIDDELEGFSCVVAHHTDVGGLVPGSNSIFSKEIFQEGLSIPTLKLYERGVPNAAILAIIEKNVRVPVLVLGDLRAEITAAIIGERAYLGLANKYGANTLRDYTDELLNLSEQMAREEIRGLPNGTYRCTCHIDGDNALAEPVVITVALTIEEDRIVVDFEGSSPQVNAGINLPLAVTASSARGAIRMVLGPTIPNSAGFFRAIEVRGPEASVVNARSPAACGAGGITDFRVTDAVLGALAKAVPERVPADGEGGNTNFSIGGYNSRFEPFVYVDVFAGARGGGPWGDGVEGIPHPNSNTANTPIEMIEVDLPLQIVEYAMVPDTGGPGKYRGGLAQSRQVRLLADDAVIQVRSDKRRFLPFGLAGGQPGTPSMNIMNPGSHQQILPPLAGVTMKQGDVLRHVMAGGGGWGNPLERDPEQVRFDVWNEKISIPYAEREYGVVIDPKGLVVDVQATQLLRSRLRGEDPISTE